MLPINISLTGHRDIDVSNESEYRGKIRQVLTEILDEHPNTKVNLMCGMAEGADIIGANVALEMKEEYTTNAGESRVGLVAVLPMAKQDFVNTFSMGVKEKNIKEFEDALSQADKVYDLSKVYTDSSFNENPYVRLGMFLVDNSQAIIALWNGVINNKKGGTSSVVEYALNGTPDEYRERYSIMDAGDTIPVYHILTQRTSPSQKVYKIDYIEVKKDWGAVLYPKMWEKMRIDKNDVEKYYNNIFTEFDSYNKNVQKHKIDNNSYLLNVHSSISMEQVRESDGMNEIVYHQCCFSDIAQVYQKKTWSYSRLQLLLGLISFLWVVLYDEILSNCSWISTPDAALVLLLAPISVLACILVYRVVSKNRIENRYYDYRAMSENLRVQFYWKLAGLKDNTYSHYSRKNEWELGWIIAAAKNISIDINYELCTSSRKKYYQDLKQCWIDDQIEYFNNKCARNKKTVRVNSMFKNVLFGLGVAAAILLFLQARWQIIGVQQFVFLFAVDFFLSFGAVFHNYLEQRQFETEYDQYKRMTMFLMQAKVKYEKAFAQKDYKNIDKILVEIGYDALAENADWVVFNRMSSIDIPMG